VVKRDPIRKIKPPMERGNAFMGKPSKQGKLEQINVKVNDVEFLLHPKHAVQHHQRRRRRVVDPCQSQAERRTREEMSSRF
jgi:hypothetical protein